MNGVAAKSTAQPVQAARPDRDELPEDDACVRLNTDSLHDLVSPLNQVCSITDLILKKYRGALDDDAEVLFGFVQSSTKRLQNLLAGMKTYTEVTGSQGPLRRSDANALLAGATASIQQAIAQSGAVLTNDHLPELYCDPNQMICVFASLIENAIKFRSEHRPEIHISAVSQEDAWVFSVRDNGIGIDPRHRERIFGMFKRVHNDTYPGAGVGLAIVKRIVERHHGRIWIESDLGRGATFFLAFPKVLVEQVE